ncbi:MAG: hypothetical protein EBQ96_05180 [Proteobacteria bacterium]|nr:hypothetical protein [Pseudomonadota bacterium]
MAANRFFQDKRSSFRNALLGTTCLIGLAFGVTAAEAQDLPVYNSTLFGTVDVTNVTARQQNIAASNIAGAIFDSFNVCTVCTVNINSEGSDALFVGVINSSSFQPTRILGTINSNARTVLRDSNGFIFGRDSVVNVPGLVVTTGELDMAALENNQPSFDIDNLADSTITLRGTINVEEGGFAAFVAPQVRNFGVINAKLGRVALAAGEVITVDMYGDNLISLAADPATTEAIIQQRGEINAEGGVVQLSANAASATVNNLVNMTGIVRTASATVKGGKIILSGGRVNVAGTLDARGAEVGEGPVGGGDIEITSRNDTYIRDEAYVVTNEGGSVNIVSGDDIRLFGSEIAPGPFMSAVDSFGGDITFDAAGQIVIEEGQIVDAGGGDIDFTNDDGLLAAEHTIRTGGEGSIHYEQVMSRVYDSRNTVQAALDAVINVGDGLTSLYVDAGEWNEYVSASGESISNLEFYGAQWGEDARGAGEFTDGETVLTGASFYSMDSVSVDGFYFGEPNPEGEITLSGSPWIDGISVYDTGDVTIVNNIIRNYAGSGIYVANSGTVEISQNNLDGQGNIKGSYGVQLSGVNDATISDNDIANNNAESEQAGIFVDYQSFRRKPIDLDEDEHFEFLDRPTPNIVISGNNLTDNSYGMVFETGNIDLTGETNTIVGGEVGMLFIPPVIEDDFPEVDGEFSPEPLVDTFSPELTLVGNTIGTTVFDGQSTYFVELANGALFNPGTPTILDGNNATYVTPFGTVTPSVTGGLTGDQFSFLETMFQHFIDDNTLGLFLFGSLATPGSFNIEDTYRNAIANYQANNPGPGFTILGLPSTGFNVGTRGFGLPGNLNDIAPAAGGNSASGLNNIAPAAGGGSQASCWQDAVNNAAQGNASTYNMSTDPDDALNAAASCGAS